MSPEEQVRPRNGLRPLLAKLALVVVAPIVFFVLLEAGLRIGGYGRDVRFFIPDSAPGVYRTNPRFTELFFPASFGLKPVNFRIARHKPPGTVRVFVLGESAAMGVPEPAFALAPQLQSQLRAMRPDAKVEVYNLGITAINSYAIVEIARQAVDFEPDLFVVYMGNNEVVGPFGASSVVEGGMPPRAVIRMSLFLRSTRTGQLLGRIARSLGMRGGGNREWSGMEMFAGKTVAAGDPRLGVIRKSFAANLGEILSLAGSRGVKTVLSTVAVNVHDCAPFASIPAEPQAALTSASRALEIGKTGEAAEFTREAAAAQPGYAEAQFRLARLLETNGDISGARPHYFKALEADALRFRTDAELNAIIRGAAKTHPDTVVLVDAARELGSDPDSSAPLAGHRFFFEHVHLKWEGNYVLARLLAGPSARALWGDGTKLGQMLDSEGCARAVGFTTFGRLAQLMNMEELTGRPPFTGQWTFAADRTLLQDETSAAQAALGKAGAVRDAIAVVDNAVTSDPENAQLIFQAAAVHLQAGDYRGALALNDRYAKLAPPSGEHAVQHAFLLQQLGRGNEAEELLLETARREPYYFQTYPLLAQIWAANGKTSRAVDEFAKLAIRIPDSRVVRRTYAELLGRSGDWSGAEREWSRLLLGKPDDETVLAPFVDRLLNTNRSDKAIGLMLHAYATNPRSYANDSRLAQVFSEKGDAAKTVEYLRALGASGPVNARFHIDLATYLGKLGRDDEMKVELVHATDAAKTEGDTDALREADELLRRAGN